MPYIESEGLKEFSKEEMIEYGQKKFSEYRIGGNITEMLKKDLDRVRVANESVEEGLNRIEYQERIIEFLQGAEDSKLLEDIFSRQNYDWKKFLDDMLPKEEEVPKEVFVRILFAMNKIIVKDESFEEAVREREEKGIEFSGLKDDEDVQDIEVVLNNIFTWELMNKCLISSIDYKPDVVHVWFGSNAESYYLPMDKYEEWKREMPSIVDHKTRAENFGNWNATHEFSDTYLSYPLNMYSFVDEDLSKFEYLNGVPEDKKMRYYKIGTITHEFGHNIYYNLMNSELRRKWQEIIDAGGGSLTSYADKYRSGTHGNEVNYNEEFGEAIRLLTTAPEYLKSKNIEAFEFLRSEFPEIKSIKE